MPVLRDFPALEQFIKMGERIMRSLPEGIVTNLNGGIIVRPERRHHPRAQNRALILGQYVYEPSGLGRYILLFYGSFRARYGGLPQSRVEEELRKTICHELQHHWEHLSGTRDLALEDLRRLRELLS